MRDISNRQDIDKLIRAFYTTLRQDRKLGPMFDVVIPEERLWDHHFEKLIDFWDSNLLKGKKYDGKPVGLHLWVDNLTRRRITKEHFDLWLGHWFEAIDGMFSGPIADLAKDRAVKMGDTFHKKIMEGRPEKYK